MIFCKPFYSKFNLLRLLIPSQQAMRKLKTHSSLGKQLSFFVRKLSSRERQYYIKKVNSGVLLLTWLHSNIPELDPCTLTKYLLFPVF
jgi:hypothetical protein